MFLCVIIIFNQQLFCSTAPNLDSKKQPPWLNSFKEEKESTKYYFITKNKEIKNNILEVQFILCTFLETKRNKEGHEKLWKYSDNKFSSQSMRVKKNGGMDYQYNPSECKDCIRIKELYKLFIWSKQTLSIPKKLEDIKFVLMAIDENGYPKTLGMDKYQLKDMSLCYFTDSLVKPVEYTNVCDNFFYDNNGFAYIQYRKASNEKCSDKPPNSIITNAKEVQHIVSETKNYIMKKEHKDKFVSNNKYAKMNETKGSKKKVNYLKNSYKKDKKTASDLDAPNKEKKNSWVDTNPSKFSYKDTLDTMSPKRSEKIPELKPMVPIEGVTYYYHNNFGYVHYNNELETYSLGDQQNLNDIIVTNINSDLKATYSPLTKFSENKYKYYKPDSKDFSIVWKKNGDSFFVPFGKISYSFIDRFERIRLINEEEINAYNMASKASITFNTLNNSFYDKNKINRTEWMNLKNTLQKLIDYKNNNLINDEQFGWFYEKSKEGNRIIIGHNQMYLEKIHKNWNLKQPTNHQSTYFFFPGPLEPSSKTPYTYNLYPSWDEVVKYRKTKIYNEQKQYIFQIIDNKFVYEDTYIDTVFNQTKLIKKTIGYWVIIDDFSDPGTLLLTQRYQRYKTSQEFIRILKNCRATHSRFRMDSIQGRNPPKKLDIDNINLGREFSKTAEIEWAMPALEQHSRGNENVMWELHMFLSRSNTTLLEENQIKLIFDRLTFLNVIRIVIWEFVQDKPRERTNYQNVFRNAKLFSIKYKHQLIYNDDCEELISIPYTIKNKTNCIQ